MKFIIVCIIYRLLNIFLFYFDLDFIENFIYVLLFNVLIYLLGDLNCRFEDSNNFDVKVFINFCGFYKLLILIIMLI